ncbi:haloacid dehalogenase-like hydrolase [Streptomyces sp. tea 10]|nr:haloacid dehalogenase-like hydrolase [Streptomyces sp. tea 10]
MSAADTGCATGSWLRNRERALTAQHIRHAGELRDQGHALPGAAAALDALAAAGLRQTVVSGNVRAVAKIKLNVFGLNTHIHWDGSAYGEDAELRAGIVKLALTRSSVAAPETVLIGDTPADVEGGLAMRVRVVAVATGRSSAEELRAAGAHAVVPNLTDAEGLLKLVTGVVRPAAAGRSDRRTRRPVAAPPGDVGSPAGSR